MTRACLLIVHDFDPPHSFTLSVARSLRKTVDQVLIIGVGGRSATRHASFGGGVDLLRVRNDGAYFSPFVSLLNPLTFIKMLIAALGQSASIYWCHAIGTLPVGVALKLCGRTVVYDVGDDDPSNVSYYIEHRLRKPRLARFVERLLRGAERVAVRRVDYVVTLTDSLKHDREPYARRIRSIYYAPADSFRPGDAHSGQPDRPGDGPVIIYSGSVLKEKGAEEVISAFALVQRRLPAATLLIVGGIPKHKDSQMGDAAWGESSILTTGWLPYDEMPRFMRLGKIGIAIVKPVNYSYRISLPFRVLEQMACGLPVVASRGLPEVEKILDSARCGLLVDPTSPQEIADAVLEILSDESTRQTMGSRGVEYIRNNHNIDRLEREISEVCGTVLGGRPDATGTNKPS